MRIFVRNSRRRPSVPYWSQGMSFGGIDASIEVRKLTNGWRNDGGERRVTNSSMPFSATFCRSVGVKIEAFLRRVISSSLGCRHVPGESVICGTGAEGV